MWFQVLDSLIIFLYYFGPLCIYATWKISQMLRLGGIGLSIMSTTIMTIIAMFTFFEVSQMLGHSIPPYESLLGYWSIVWPIMFWVGLAILRHKNYYSFFRSIMLSFLATISALAVWEIPIHVMTIYLNPTLYQVALTTMLAFPTGIMIIPFRMESRYDINFQKSFPLYWRRYINNVISRPIVIGLALVALEIFNSRGFIIDSTGYPVELFQMLLRVGFAGVFLEYLWRTPSRYTGEKAVKIAREAGLE